jgi:hypothetical protein
MNAETAPGMPGSRVGSEPEAGHSPDFVMVGAPDIAHAGRVGDMVTLTDRTEHGVYVLFHSGIRECYPTIQFSNLFSRLR